jgi:hypothetical protein
MTATKEKRPQPASVNGAARAGSDSAGASHRQGSHRGRPKKVQRPASSEAKRRAAAILEVLGGLRLPSDAASALGVSLPRYYLLEQQALSGLLTACEPRAKGPVMTAESRVSCLERELTRLRQECGRHQALVRAAQRTVGLSPPAAAKSPVKGLPEKGKPSGKKGRRRRPTVRALRAAQSLRGDDQQGSPPCADSSGPNGPSAVEPRPPSEAGTLAASMPPCVVLT